MTALSLLTVASAFLSLALWRGWGTKSQWPFMRPVALVSVAIPVLDVAQWTIQRAVLDGQPTPYTGTTALWFHLQTALFLGLRFAVLAAGIATFASLSPRRLTWIALPLWLATSLAFAALYPGLRQGPRWIAHGIVSAGCAGAVFGLGRWYMRRGAYHAGHIAALVLAVGQAGASVAYLRSNPERDWDVARWGYGLAFAALIWYQASQIWRYRS